MMAEQSDADVNISYYGVGLDNLLGDLGKVTKPLIVHIADKDVLPARRPCQGGRGREGP
jgi:carboxymethylenebutenolidase